MAKQKPEEWIEASEAASILTANSNHQISPDYVRRLGRKGKLGVKPKDRRTNLYLKSDVQSYTVKEKSTK